MSTQQHFAGGKYTVISDKGSLTALRHGEPWQDLTGNNLVYWMLVDVDRLKDALEAIALTEDADTMRRMAREAIAGGEVRT